MKILVICVIYLAYVSVGETACTFPADLLGIWDSSSLEQLNFTDTSTVVIPNIHTYGAVTFNCESVSGSKYILRSSSTVVTLFGTPMEAATCLQLVQVTSSAKYTYIHATTPLQQAGNERVKLNPVSASLTEAAVCDESTPYPDGTYDILIKNGALSLATVTCPDVLLSKFSYTVDGNCFSNSSLDVCSDNTKLQFNYSICSSVAAYSSGGDLSCVYSNVYNSMTYVTLYNNDATTDESTTYRYTCMVVAANGSLVYATQNPQHCLSTQTSNNVTSPGLALILKPINCAVDTTPSPTTTIPPNNEAQVGTASVAAGTTIAIIAVIALIFLLLFFLVFRKGAPYPMKKGQCACSSKCGPLMYCLSCQCCCGKVGRGTKIDPEGHVISPEEIGVVAGNEESQVTGNGREVDVIPAPTPPGAKDIEELQEISTSSEDGKPRRLPPIETSVSETVDENETQTQQTAEQSLDANDSPTTVTQAEPVEVETATDKTENL
ncbi:hypothetical protein SNE40_011695 [Patella caerulea]|uniref:DUF7042 domain-containing protein n=1 Tax=Patella caerulea TaxID=87958 RepID=A0AAN8JNW8_PATCE